MQFATITKSNIKMIKSEPRPAWVWSDVPAYGCATSFGSPSGHSTRAANIVFMVILDVFFASAWSRKAYPHLNKISIRSHPVIFTLLVVKALHQAAIKLEVKVVDQERPGDEVDGTEKTTDTCHHRDNVVPVPVSMANVLPLLH